jgi:hypothetical protein
MKNKKLNIVYFIGNGKTKSLNLPVNSFIYGSLGCALILVWTCLSTYYLYTALVHIEILQEKLEKSLSTVFDYQVTYNQVFENAYPEQTNEELDKITSIKGSDENNNNQAEEDLDDFFGFKSFQIVNNSSKDWSVFVEEVSIQKTNSTVLLSFSIRNNENPLRKEGLIQSKLNIVNKNNEKKELVSNKESYSIRFYKSKKTAFDISTQSGVIKSLEINLFDDSNSESFGSFSIPLNVHIPATNNAGNNLTKTTQTL